jgi:hypothetical protein
MKLMLMMIVSVTTRLVIALLSVTDLDMCPPHTRPSNQAQALTATKTLPAYQVSTPQE